MRLQADCSSVESALRRLAAVAACVGEALAGNGDAVGTGALRAVRRGCPERRTATGAAPEAFAIAGAARCCAAQQQAAHRREQPHRGEGAEAGAGPPPGAAWGPGSAAGRKGEPAQDGSGSALPHSVRTSGWGAECGPAPTAPSAGERAARDGVPGLALGKAAGHSSPSACPAAAVPGVGSGAAAPGEVDLLAGSLVRDTAAAGAASDSEDGSELVGPRLDRRWCMPLQYYLLSVVLPSRLVCRPNSKLIVMLKKLLYLLCLSIKLVQDQGICWVSQALLLDSAWVLGMCRTCHSCSAGSSGSAAPARAAWRPAVPGLQLRRLPRGPVLRPAPRPYDVVLMRLRGAHARP